MLHTPAVLAVLVEDRQRAIARDRAFGRHAALRRAVARVVLALGFAVLALAHRLERETGIGDVVA